MTINKLLPGIQKNIPLKNFTSFLIGGPAKYFLIVKKKEELVSIIKKVKKEKIPFYILGKGTNLLVSDKGFNGLVIKILLSKFYFLNSKTELPFMEASRRTSVLLRPSLRLGQVKMRTKSSSPSKIFTEAGVNLGELVNASVKKRLSGLEWLVGIPGTVGGAVFGNAGAFGKSMKDVVEKIEVFDTKNFTFRNYGLRDCKFIYRESIFKKRNNLIIVSAVLKLKKGKEPEIKKEIKENLNYKKRTQPLNLPSAGSVFKNTKKNFATELSEEDKSSSSSFAAARLGEEKRFSSSSFAAARLIEECGLKGKTMGGAKISEKHANFIVNLGGARAKDVKKLINLAKKEVKKRFGVKLEEEIQYLGF